MTPRERRSVASLALLYVFRMLGLFMVLPLLALYASDYPGATPALVGLALGIYGLTQATLQIPLGWLSDHVGRKTVILGGLALFAAGSVIAALSQSIEGIIFGRALQGAGAIAGTLLALLADLTRPEQRTKAMAVVGVSIGMSFAIALVLGPAVASVGGLVGVFWLAGLMALLGAGIVVFLVPDPAQGPPLQHAEVGARRGMILRSLTSPGLARQNFGVFSLHLILMASFMVIPEMLEAGVGIDRNHHWTVYLPVLLLSLVGMVPLMMLSERRQRPRLAFLAAIAALVAALLVLDVTSFAPLLYAAMWLFFVGFNFLEATLPSRVSREAPPEAKGTAMGVFSSCQFMGAFCGGAVGGWVLQHWDAATLLGASMLLAALWFLLEWRFSASDSVLAESARGAEV